MTFFETDSPAEREDQRLIERMRQAQSRERAMPLKELINACLALKPNEDFALFYLPGLFWRADIVNSCKVVMLGECDGDYRGEGATAEQAVANLLKNLQEGKQQP